MYQIPSVSLNDSFERKKNILFSNFSHLMYNSRRAAQSSITDLQSTNTKDIRKDKRAFSTKSNSFIVLILKKNQRITNQEKLSTCIQSFSTKIKTNSFRQSLTNISSKILFQQSYRILFLINFTSQIISLFKFLQKSNK